MKKSHLFLGASGEERSRRPDSTHAHTQSSLETRQARMNRMLAGQSGEAGLQGPAPKTAKGTLGPLESVTNVSAQSKGKKETATRVSSQKRGQTHRTMHERITMKTKATVQVES